MHTIYTAVLKVVIATFFFLIPVLVFSQSIRINMPEYNNSCSGTTIEVPVNLDGIWSGSSFVAKFEANGESDTTFYVTAENTTSPLRFKLPKIYADRKFSYERDTHICRLTISSTLPEIRSYNSVFVFIRAFPTIKLGNPLQGYDYYSYAPGGPIHEYVNPGEPKMFDVDALGLDDPTDGFKLNDSTTYTLGYSHNNKFAITTNVQKTYSIARVWNACGAGRIIPHQFTIKVNPFENLITDYFPKEICNDRELNLSFDYKGTYNNNNVFKIEIANLVGDTVRQVPAIVVSDKKVKCILDNTFRPGSYYVRVKSSSPEGTTAYKLLNIYRLTAVFNWGGIGSATTVDYKQEIRLWAGLQYSPNGTGPKLLALRLSDGKLLKAPEYNNNYDNNFELDIYPDKNQYYTVDSMITTCGVVKDFDMVEDRYLTISNSFSIKGQKKGYCLGEKVKVKIDSPVNFNPGNQFTAKIYTYANVFVGTFPATFQHDSVSFTLSSGNGFNPNIGQYRISVESSNPAMHSTSTDGFFYMYRKPTMSVYPENYILEKPGSMYITGDVYSHSPISVVINNGQKDTTVNLRESDDYLYYANIAILYVKKNTTFSVTSATNSCGTSQFSGAEYQVNVTVNTPQAPTMSFGSGVFKTLCINKPTPIYFNYGGNFNSNNDFVIYYARDGWEKIEVGRGKTSPIMITIPPNLPSGSTNRLLLESTSPMISGYYDVDDLVLVLRESNERGFGFGTPMVDGYNFSSLEDIKKNGGIELVKGDKLIQSFLIYSTPYTVYDDDPVIKFKVNNQWFSQIQPVRLTAMRDTTLFLQGVENVCGVVEIRDTIPVKIKKYKLTYNILDAPAIRCMESFMDVSVTVGGETNNVPKDFKFEFIPQIKPDQKYTAQVSNKNGNYRIKIPDMPYEGNFTLKVSSLTRQNEFVKDYSIPDFYLEKQYIAKITALDGSDTLWANPHDYYYPTSPTVKIETLNSFNPNWNASINTGDGRLFNVQSKITIKDINFNSSASDNYDYGFAEITSGRGTCGFTKYSGKVFLRKCIGNVILNRDELYEGFGTKKYVSNGSIQSNEFYPYTTYPYYPLFINFNTNILFSAKKSIVLMPGFSTVSGAVFKAEIKGCTTTPTE